LHIKGSEGEYSSPNHLPEQIKKVFRHNYIIYYSPVRNLLLSSSYPLNNAALQEFSEALLLSNAPGKEVECIATYS